MIDPSSLLRSYLRGVLHLCGAEAACIYLPARSAMPAALLQEGHGDPPAELADLSRAAAFAEEVAARRKTRAEGGRRRGLSSSSPAAVLVPIGCPDPAETAPERRRYDRDAPCAGWLGLAFAPDGAPARQRLSELPPELWECTVEQGSALVAHALQVSGALRDPVSDLPNRQALQSALASAMEEAGASGRPLSLLFLNPDDFEMVNRELGREAGDRVIRELAARLRSALRGSDLAARYGGVVHAALLQCVGPAEARPTAEKVLQRVTEGAFLDGAVRLGVSAGMAWFDPANPDGAASPFDLIHRADQALSAAKRAGGSRLAVWDARLDLEEIGNLDRLTGMFTGNLSRDYRNMVLLWEALNAIAESEEPDRLAGRVVQRIQATFLPDRVALFVRCEGGQPKPLCHAGRWPEAGASGGLGQLAAHEREVVERACQEPQPVEKTLEGSYACAVPLATSLEHLGCLFLGGSHPCDSSDLIFLKGLAAQLAVALDRARLARVERERQAAERQRLERELGELRSALQRARLESISPEMAKVIATARRVAPTDATILITGESGTGKELLANTIHELSERRNRPFVVVDCSALAATLAESELFGHERGAYTGAQERTAGRLASADGGTVLLDEIGELPLEVQSKLLRFVQEKQLTPVGGTRPRTVDVRILAATNRDLAAEVAAGRFRGDLYYRLKVVQLEVPPLRARRHDILHLARHFLRAQAVLYRKPVTGFTFAAEAAMLQHPWPGNVRELQNRVMQAVLLCDGEEIAPAEMGFDLPRPVELGTGDATTPAPAGPGEPAWPAAGDEAWSELGAQLGRLVRQAAAGGAGAGVMPLGRWLQNDLVLEAHTAASGIARRGAALLGLPETTFRNRCHAALDQVEAGMTFRPSGWEAVRSAIRGILASGCPPGEDLLERAQQILLREIVALIPAHARLGPALLGVTPPTYRRRVEALHGGAHGAGCLAGNGSASSPLCGLPHQLSL